MPELAKIDPSPSVGLARALWEDYLRAFPTLPRDSHAAIKRGILEYAERYELEIRKHRGTWTWACGACSRSGKPGLPQVMGAFEAEMFHREALERRPEYEGMDCSVADLVAHIARLKAKYLPGMANETSGDRLKKLAHEALAAIAAKRSVENGEL